MQDTILIVDFGSQYTQLIARRIRELNIYCEIHPYTKIPALGDNVKGIVLSGSPSAACGEKAPKADLGGVTGKVPLLGIGYGAYLLALNAGGKVESVSKRDYGRTELDIADAGDPLFKGVASPAKVWMSYGDKISALPEGFTAVGSLQSCDAVHNTPNAAFRKTGEQVWGVVFHPEVNQTEEGLQILKNFCTDICKCDQGWSPESFVEHSVKDLKEMLGNDKVVLGLSGGVDSSVAAVLLHRAIGANLYCIFVDTGLLRKNEFRDVLESYKNMGLNVRGVDASAKFLGDLAGVTDPEAKRKIIGRDFIEVFNAEAKAIQGVRWLGQGTIYPDIVESVSVDGSVAVKSHHNVGGLPKEMSLDIVEPLRLLFKDEVRRVGRVLGIDPMILDRHPFPGPGLGVRVLGEVTPERVRILQDADKIYIDTLREYGLYGKVWQAGAILLPIQSVGVQGDARTYESCVALRAVMSTDGMTADWIHLPYEFLMKVSNDIINKVQGVNRVVYDISSKPPATIEWE